MTCPECAAHPHELALFCTECGADLLAERSTHEPISVGSWDQEPPVTPGMTTEPIPDVVAPVAATGLPARPSPERGAHRPTPVKEMVGSERSAWLDSVWGPVAGAEG